MINPLALRLSEYTRLSVPDLTAIDAEVDAIEDAQIPEALRHALQLEHRPGARR